MKLRKDNYKVSFLLLLQIIFLCSIVAPGKSQSQPFIKGADVSFLPQLESNGAVFKDSGIAKSALEIFKAHGINYIRLRIWHTPPAPDSANNLAKTLAMAKRIKQQGLQFLLDFHYSDWWADPIHQTIPAAWSSLPFTTLRDSVYRYTLDVMTAMKEQQTLPDMVQLGNEISCGMLWNIGNVCGANNTNQQWYQLGEFLKAGVHGVKNSLESGDSVRIMIHTDKGADYSACVWFFDNMLEENVPFDIIGLSYYPWWHGTLSQLASNMNGLAQRYNKDIIVVETAYPWTLGWNDPENNIVGDISQLHEGYSATVAGQQTFLRDLQSVLRAVPNNKGAGVMYWEPDWISAPTFNSAWENLSMFNFTGNALASFQAFEPPKITSQLLQGWNTVSLPVLSFERKASAIFPSASSSAFIYTGGGYVVTETLQTGKSYWLKFASSQPHTFSGDSLTSISIALQAGWNMVGSISSPIAVSALQQQPDSSIVSGYFSFDGGYLPADTLLPGKGYWVKTNGAGTLIMQKQ